MTDEEETVSHDGPLSWRDVYKAVGESEKRIVQAIQDATGPLTKDVENHEDRIRELEVHGSVSAQALDREVEALREQVRTNSTLIQSFISREGGIFGTLGALRVVLAMVLSVIIAVGAVVGAIAAFGGLQ